MKKDLNVSNSQENFYGNVLAEGMKKTGIFSFCYNQLSFPVYKEKNQNHDTLSLISYTHRRKITALQLSNINSVTKYGFTHL